MTESGDIVPKARVRRIRLAQDVLNAAEESVYDVLWNAKPLQRSDTDQFRIVQAGYDHLMKRSRLSKKTIQRIIDRLIEKDFITIERPADIYHRTSTCYRVFSYRTVLDRHAARNRLYAVKIGPGFLFARRLEPEASTPHPNMTTVAGSKEATVAKLSTLTGAKDNLTTVVPPTTSSREQLPQEASSSSGAVARLRALIEPALGMVDDDGLQKLLQLCRGRAPDCTPDEIAYFVEQKLRLVRSIQNPLGFMLSAIPRHFEGQGYLQVRAQLRQLALERLREWTEAREFWTAIAQNPLAPDEDRAQARSVLETLSAPPDDSVDLA